MKTRATDEKGKTKDIAESGSTKKATKEDVKKQTTVLMRSAIFQSLADISSFSCARVFRATRTLSTIVQTLDDLPDNRHIISMRVRCLQLWCHATNSDQA